MSHFRINQRCITHSKVCGLNRNGVRHATFWCAPYSVFLCGLRRFMQAWRGWVIWASRSSRSMLEILGSGVTWFLRKRAHGISINIIQLA
jgi:hypothetical protein